MTCKLAYIIIIPGSILLFLSLSSACLYPCSVVASSFYVNVSSVILLIKSLPSEHKLMVVIITVTTCIDNN